MCRCPSPPKLIAIQNLKCQRLDGGPAISQDDAVSLARQQMQNEALQNSEDQIVLRLLDEYSQQPLATRRYRLEFPEKVLNSSVKNLIEAALDDIASSGAAR